MDFSLSHWEAGREEHSTAPGPSAPAWVCHLNRGRRDRTKGPLPGEGAHRAPKNVHSLQPSSWDKSIFQRFPAHLDLSVCQQHLRCHTSGSGPAQSATKARNSLCPQTSDHMELLTTPEIWQGQRTGCAALNRFHSTLKPQGILGFY